MTSELVQSLKLLCTPEFEKATVVLALICASAVIALFGYLGRTTGGRHFGMWMVAYLFHALYLASTILLGVVPDDPLEAALLAGATGISALLIFWGNFHLASHARTRRELLLAVVVMAAWCYAGATLVRPPSWLMVPVFLLLGAARFHTGFLYLRYRDRNRGTNVLTAAFLLCGLHAVAYPFLSEWRAVLAAAHLTSSVLALMIAIGMIVEEECRASDEKYRGVLDASPAALFMVDLWSLRVLDSNKSAQRLTKLDADGLLGCSMLDLCPHLREQGNNLLDHRTMINAVFKPFNEFHIACSDGTTALCEGEARLVQWHKRPVLQIRVRQADKREKIGQVVRRAEKLSSLGQLVAGVAHELNNPLAVVVGYAQIMAKAPEIDANVKRNLVKILHESERASKIVRDLLSFARPCEPQMTVVNLNAVVTNVLEMRESDLRAANIRVEKRLAPSLPATKADPIQIEQVLTNLITNAIHALAASQAERVLTVSTEGNGFFLRVVVADNGPGISPEIISRIFDPFFTTKPPGKGTGLGLSISHTILEEHHGKIWAESELGKGATFFVELPMIACDTAAQTAALAPASEPEQSEQAQKQRLLVVDDEPGIREVLHEILTSCGYTVDVAANGSEAIKRVFAHHYDLIISDLCMPEIDGEKLYGLVRDAKPRLAERIVFVTGDTVSPKSRAFLESVGNRWLSKPFNISDIEQVVSDHLKAGNDEEALLGHLRNQ